MAKALSKPESNLKKLTKSPIPMNFVKKHDFKIFGWYRIVLGALVLLFFGVQALLAH